ncbi:MAG: ribosomal protein S18 acetylase RimI-like enzyme [Pseudohongiellaceae bacterium]|jgi:ribosomal protein S18 acetylase RimI-like enzyme
MKNTNDYELVAEVVMVEDFMRLRKVSGLSSRPESAAALGLKSSLYGVYVKHGALVVGMGRVIGDGGLNLEVVDVAVAPEYQGFGLGRMVMEALMTYLNATAAPGAYITLMADVQALYEKFGFAFSLPGSEDMYYQWDTK